LAIFSAKSRRVDARRHYHRDDAVPPPVDRGEKLTVIEAATKAALDYGANLIVVGTYRHGALKH
jgi:nucleotide-binding universal stress UspA family protein